MRQDDVEMIASAVAAMLRRQPSPGRSRPPFRGAPPAARKPKNKPRRSGRSDLDSLASEICAALALPPGRARGGNGRAQAKAVSAFASEVLALLAPTQLREDLPLQSIEI